MFRRLQQQQQPDKQEQQDENVVTSEEKRVMVNHNGQMRGEGNDDNGRKVAEIESGNETSVKERQKESSDDITLVETNAKTKDNSSNPRITLKTSVV